MQLHIKKAFTIMEVMTVVIIVGVIAVFAIPNFSKTMEKSYEQDALTQLTAIHAAQDIYRAQTGAYWSPGVTYDVTAINSNLGLSIMENGMQYTCYDDLSGGYFCFAIPLSGSGSFCVTLTEDALSATNPKNPVVGPAEGCSTP